MNDGTEVKPLRDKIGIWGVGDWGITILNRVNPQLRRRVKTVAVNSDLQSLVLASASHKLQIGKRLTQGLGTGGDSDLGEKAFLESEAQVRKALAGSEVLLLVAGLGGGVGTGVTPALCRLASSQGLFTVVVATRPFAFEGKRKASFFREGLKRIAAAGGRPLYLSLDRLVGKLDDDAPYEEAFHCCDTVMETVLECLISYLTAPSPRGGDCAVLKSIISAPGESVLGMHEDADREKLVAVMKGALSNLFLSAQELGAVRGCLVQIQSGQPVSLNRVREAISTVGERLNENAVLAFSVEQNGDLGDRVRVALLACGVAGERAAADSFPVVMKADYRPPRQTEMDFNRSTRGRFSDSVPTVMEGEDLDIPTFIRKGERLG